MLTTTQATELASYAHGIGLEMMMGNDGSTYFDYDALGSTVGVTASDSVYVNRYAYTPFGGSLFRQETIENPFEYIGQYGVMNEDNGLQLHAGPVLLTRSRPICGSRPFAARGRDANFYRYAAGIRFQR